MTHGTVTLILAISCTTSAAADDRCALFHIEAHCPIALQYTFRDGPFDAALSTSLVAIKLSVCAAHR